MKYNKQHIGIILLLIAIGFNLWTYRLEPSSAVDPNDNAFQFALVDRTSQVWDFAQQTCSGISKPFCMMSYLVDHWVPNWAEGYNLPSYYSHIPQIMIVSSHHFIRFIGETTHTILQGGPLQNVPSLFTYYHWVIYLLLCLFPVSAFLALRIIGVTWVSAGIGALLASQLSTDGLYGLDPASFLWRGYGLSSQLFSMIWLPLALAYAWRYFRRNAVSTLKPPRREPFFKRTETSAALPAILTLAAATAGHLGIGITAFMSVGILAVSPFIRIALMQSWDKQTVKLAITTGYRLLAVYAGVGLLLAYWILPIFRGGNYHNISVWDGIWKFNSFGYRDVLKNLLNGDLFDFGRLPVLTMLTGFGLFASLSFRRTDQGQDRDDTLPHFAFGMLFLFWLLLYFGRTTWGRIIDLIPGMSEFHLSRFIVGIHAAGLFLMAIGIDRIRELIVGIPHNPSRILLTTLGISILVATVFPQTIRYAAYNDTLIIRGNASAQRSATDTDALIRAIRTRIADRPGRVFAGRGGSWGKTFNIAETPMYMHLSTYGIPVILWLPETWSPNSDTEQYFSETNADHYNLYNVRYVATPIDLPNEHIQPFWRLLEAGNTWKLYEVATDGYITAGVRPAIVSSTKTDYRNLVRLWMHSDAYASGLFPELTFDPKYPKQTGLPNFRMTDEATYRVPDGSIHSLFAEPPLYLPPGTESPAASAARKSSPTAGTIVTVQSGLADMRFAATVTVPDPCTECVVVLKHSFHPSWTATVDGKPVTPFAVFPFFTAVTLDTPGTHEVVFTYRPSPIKQILLLLSFVTLGGIFAQARHNRLNNFNSCEIGVKAQS